MVFRDNQAIPKKYTCDGDNVSPPLDVLESPPEARSLVLMVDDPDSPSGNFLHWLAWNIDPHIDDIPEGKSPKGGVQGINDFGKTGYGGPCPHHGRHRYRFNLYALDVLLDLKPSATRKEVEESMRGHICAETQLTGFYTKDRPHIEI